MREFELGRAVPRIEDLQLLRGRGRYTDDITLPRQAHLYVLRSPHAAARILKLDIAAASEAPGVIAILTGKDAVADGLGILPSRVARKRPDGKPNFVPPYRILALDRVHLVGEPVAAVIAESLGQAKDAADLVEIDYEILPSATDTAEAAAPGAPAVWDEVPDNVCFVERLGNKEAVDAAFARAEHVVTQHFNISRVAINSMEMRAAIGSWDPREERYTLYAGLQAPHQMRSDLADHLFKLPASRFRLISPDVGGGFGMKGSAFPEYGIVLWAAKKIGRPVKWYADRSESLASDHHARDNRSDVSLALDANGKFLALRVKTLANIGAFIASNGLHVPVGNLGGLAGTYTIGAMHVEVTGIFSNTSPTCPYRGAGRPEASTCIERIIEIAAAETGIDPIELRRRNMIPPAALPYKTALVYTYDSGAFEETMDKALALGDYQGAVARQAAARKRGALYGIGRAMAIEIAGGPPGIPGNEGAEFRFDPTGSATLLMGSHNHGQGHETSLRQLANHMLGIAPDRLRLAYGDTDVVFHGTGTFGSRTMATGGTAMLRAAEKVIEKGKAIAAHLLEASVLDIEFSDGRFVVAGTDRAIDLTEVAKASFIQAKLPPGMEPGLSASAILSPPDANFPNGFHLCEIEIDRDTAVPRILRYSVVDDVGRVVNPLLLKGQIHGGVAQGLGQALFEQLIYDPESGQLLTGSFMDYAMPHADDLPLLSIGSNDVPSKNNPLGIKGAGEAGCVGALPCVLNGINDALAPLGIRHFDMPATPERLWRAINGASV